MEKKFKIAFILMMIPVAINIAGTILCALYIGPDAFKGYLAGTLLSLFFSIFWLVMARKVTLSNIMVLFTVSLGSFPVKIILFAIFALGGLYILKMDQLYFGISFLFGTVVSLVIEVWFILAVNKLKINSRITKKGPE